jgi:hypothetical protein
MSRHQPAPGPWRWYADGSELAIVNADATVEVALAINEADANLIAAAPDLLAALRDMRDVWSVAGRLADVDARALYRAACEAIAKAEGRS